MTNYKIEEYLLQSLNINDISIFSIFKHPKESRFQNLFVHFKIKKKRKTMMVCPKNIMIGLDKRTSIIIKNIPNDLTPDQFKQIIFNLSTFVDFFYVPNKIRTRKKLRVAFVNVTNYLQIVPIYMGLLYHMKFKYEEPYIKMEICYSRVQGKNHLIDRFSKELNLLKNKI